MSIASENARVQYTLSGSGQTLAVPFYFLAAADLEVVKTSTAGVDSTLVLTTDYTVSGVGNPVGGSVTMVAGASGEVVTIARAVPFTQDTELAYLSQLPAATLERAYDRLAMQIQRLSLAVKRTLRIPVSNAEVAEISLNARKGKTLQFNGTTGALELTDSADSAAAAAQASATAAAVSADEAESSAAAASLSASVVQAYVPLRTAENSRFVFEGDSITSDNEIGGPLLNGLGNSWPEFAMQLPEFAGRGTYHNFAIGGSSLAQMQARYAGSVYPLRPSGAITNVSLFVWIGANDYMFGSQTAAAFITALNSYLTAAIADGFQVFLGTIMFGGYALDYRGATAEAWRANVNTWIRKQGYRCTVFDADAYLPNPRDTFFFNNDKVHPNVVGNRYIANIYNSILKGGAGLVDQVPFRSQWAVDSNGNTVFTANESRALAVTNSVTPNRAIYMRTGNGAAYEIEAFDFNAGTSQTLTLNPNGGAVRIGASNALTESNIGVTVASHFASTRAAGNPPFITGLIIANTGVTAATTVSTAVTGINRTVSFPDASGTVALETSNVASATVLQNARTINGVSFNGSANITVPISWVSVPATATSAGTAGNVAYDSNFLYICTATNTWRRAALSSW